jgi:CubicO group peptidase (beta-lactamase class C family)
MTSIHRIGLLLTTLALGLATTPHSVAQRGNPRMEFAGQSIDAMIADFMAEHAIPGLSLAIVQAPYIPRVSGHGLADIATARLVGTNTLFDLGEMTDAYTAVAVMQLVEAGKLRLNDPIGSHLSNLPASWQAISVQDLLAHASGVPDYTLDPSHDPTRVYGLADIMSLVGGRPLLFQPGQDVANSRTDYAILVGLVEAVSGQTHQAFIRANQLDRLGLRHTFFPAEMDWVRSEDVARNNNRHKDFLIDPVFINPTERAIGHRTDLAPAAGGQTSILASASDVSLYY